MYHHSILLSVAVSAHQAVPYIMYILFFCPIQNCDLTACDLQQANLRGSNLAGAIFEDIKAPLHMSQTVNVTTISIQGTGGAGGGGAGGQGQAVGRAGEQPNSPSQPLIAGNGDSEQ